MKMSLIFLKGNKVHIYGSGKSKDITLMGAALIFKAITMLSDEKIFLRKKQEILF